jgi:hypothetical protein
MGFVRIQYTEMCTDQLIYVMSIHILKVTNEKCIHIHIGDSNWSVPGHRWLNYVYIRI